MSTHKEFVNVYNTDFSNADEWSTNVVENSEYTGWIIDTDRQCAYPTHHGGYINLDDKNATLLSAIGFNRKYFYDQRKTVFDVTLFADTVLNIHFFRGDTANCGQRQSQYRIDCASKKLIMMRYIESERLITNEAYREETMPFPIVDGRRYTVKLVKDDFTFSMELFDTVTAESVRISNTGWASGSNMYCCGFSWSCGIKPPIIHNFSVYEAANPYLVEIGDSLTEGDFFDSEIFSEDTMNLYNRWAYRINQEIGHSYLCACTSATIEDVLEILDNEIAYIKPRYTMITIGTNNRNMSAEEKFSKYRLMAEKCKEIGTTLILNHIPLCAWDGYKESAEQANPYIDALDLTHCHFDVAIAKEYDIKNGCDIDKTADKGCHVNLTGADEFVKRVKADCSFLF